MTRAQKGQRRERELAQVYDAAGWQTFRPPRARGGPTDLFGLFDIVAIDPGERSHWIQVKANAGNTRINDFAQTSASLLPDEHEAFYAICYDRKGWRLIETHADDYWVVVDERDMESNMGDGVAQWLNGGTDAE